MSPARFTQRWLLTGAAVVSAVAVWGLMQGRGTARQKDVPPADKAKAEDKAEDFAALMARMKAAKPEVTKKHSALLAERYDMDDNPAKGVTMTRGKPVQQGVRSKPPKGMTWAKLAAMSPEEIKDQGLFPLGFLPLPHPNHPEGGMLFPKFHIDEIKRQEGRDLARFDLDFDLPDHFLPEFPPPMFLTTRPDLGDVSKGKLITIDNFFELLKDILNPKQIEGLRLLLATFSQQQFNASNDRRSEKPSRGVTCFDCHVNGHTNAATHLVGDISRRSFGTGSTCRLCEA